MTNKTDILKMALHVFKRGHGMNDRRGLNARREWLIGISISVCIVLAGSIMSYRMFMEYRYVKTDASENASTVVEYNENTAKKASEIYTKRQSAFLELQKSAAVTLPTNTTEPQAPTEEIVLPDPATTTAATGTEGLPVILQN